MILRHSPALIAPFVPLINPYSQLLDKDQRGALGSIHWDQNTLVAVTRALEFCFRKATFLHSSHPFCIVREGTPQHSQ